MVSITGTINFYDITLYVSIDQSNSILANRQGTNVERASKFQPNIRKLHVKTQDFLAASCVESVFTSCFRLQVHFQTIMVSHNQQFLQAFQGNLVEYFHFHSMEDDGIGHNAGS